MGVKSTSKFVCHDCVSLRIIENSYFLLVQRTIGDSNSLHFYKPQCKMPQTSIFAILSLFLQHIYYLNAWIVPNQKYYHPRRLLPSGAAFVLLLSARNEDVPQLENMFYEDEIRTRKLDKVVHVVGLFESLNTVPVEEWAGYNNDLEEGYWMNMCRDDDCEVS